MGLWRGSDNWKGQPSTEVNHSLPQPLLAAEFCTAGLLSLGEKPTALGRQVPAEPPTLQTWVNPLKGMLHELCNLALICGFPR